ncbi:Homoserine O-acetyltransferase [Melia azedarach]|uniref:Homoserine O-acetyltransferase n=1 Tax=Melia azedarach TaxID=155640 RepID=A0ACC1Y3Y3_MELAZ|nr:Homoserine O-acetyltransferase [Melia azedarach]
MAATATATGGAPKLSYTSSSNRRGLNPTKKLIGSTKFLIQNLNQSSAWSVQRPFPAQASNKPKIEEQDSGIDDDVVASSNTQEDLNYLWKLGVGSFAGAVVIKYGSVLFPEITRPNIFQALLMISAPVVVAVWLLFKQSRVEKQS